jgi:transposase
VTARRFHCDAVLCRHQIFTERFADGVLAPSARRTRDSIVHHLGLALGGRPAAGFAKRLTLPVSEDTLLRVVRRRSRPPSDPLRVIRVDDWAWRRDHRYASIVCNLERRRIVTLLPDREPATAHKVRFALCPDSGAERTCWHAQWLRLFVISQRDADSFGSSTHQTFTLFCGTLDQ